MLLQACPARPATGSRELRAATVLEIALAECSLVRDRLWIFSGRHTGGSDSWSGDVWVTPPLGASD